MSNDIDARDFGRLEAEVETLQRQVNSLEGKVDTLLELANKSKGGFWVGMGIASALGGLVTFIGEKVLR